MNDKHICRFADDADLEKARRIALRDDADYDDLAWLASVVPALVEEVRQARPRRVHGADAFVALLAAVREETAAQIAAFLMSEVEELRENGLSFRQVETLAAVIRSGAWRST